MGPAQLCLTPVLYEDFLGVQHTLLIRSCEF